jgi:hypothetical protein
MNFKTLTAAGALVLAAVGMSSAYPLLQLDIVGGTYDAGTQTVMSNSNDFNLCAMLDRYNPKFTGYDNFTISMAVTPGVNSPSDLGSVIFNGEEITITDEMTFGIPPIDAYVGNKDDELQKHGIFPTYFKEFQFNFDPSKTTAIYNAETQTGVNPTTIAGSDLAYSLFNVKTAGLADGYEVHFDLYKTYQDLDGDVGVSDFAPFSHDAQSSSPTSVPEPSSVSMMLLGFTMLGGFAFFRRKK